MVADLGVDRRHDTRDRTLQLRLDRLGEAEQFQHAGLGILDNPAQTR